MRATAYMVGPQDGSGAVLMELARQIGFEAVYPYASVAEAERQTATTPLIFFLFAPVEEPRALQQISAAGRASELPQIRFAPMVYFTEHASLDVIRGCINLGFDDIITLPVSLSKAEERISRQLMRTLTYYATPTYFGPDRRNRIPGEAPSGPRKPGAGSGGQYRRIQIVRNTAAGVKVISEDMHFVV